MAEDLGLLLSSLSLKTDVLEAVMKFLVAIDGSKASQHALAQAIRLAASGNARIVLLVVIEPVNNVYFPGMMPTGEPLVAWQGVPADQMEKMVSDTARSVLSEAEVTCREAGVQCETLLQSGSPRSIICEVAEKEAPDVLVIGSRGLGTVERLMLGSVSDYVIHHAHCPVLIVR